MSNLLDMSLDDIIKTSKKPNSKPGTNPRGRGGRGSGPGPSRRIPNLASGRNAPYSRPVVAPESTWQHDMFNGGDGVLAFPPRSGGGPGMETGTKLYISNLEYGVSNEDIKELFAEIGDLKRYSIHYDRSGRSKGTAEVVFSRRADALAAVQRYNNVQLDGKPMKIEVVGATIATPVILPPTSAGVMYNNFRGSNRGGGRGSALGRLRGGRGGGDRGGRRGRGRGRGDRGEKMSAEDLDADLDTYHKESMETS